MSCNSVIIKEAVDNDPPQKVRNSILSILYYDFSNSKFNIVYLFPLKLYMSFIHYQFFMLVFKRNHMFCIMKQNFLSSLNL